MSMSREDLLSALTGAEPLGPIAHERIVPDVLDELVYDQIAHFADVAVKPHMLFLGRKGAGKSALLSQIRMGTQKKGRRGLLFFNEEPRIGRDYVIDVYSWEHFHQIVRNVNRLLKSEDISDLTPSEFFVSLWYETLWDEIIQHFYNFHSYDAECRQLLAPVERYVMADGAFEGSAHQHAKSLFLQAKNAVIAFLNSRRSRLYFLFDSMENYPVRNPVFLRIISGLFQGLTKVSDDSPRITVSFSIPEEIETFITSGSTNLMKDFASSFRIRWRPVELVRVVAHRLRVSASIHDRKLYDQVADLDLTKRDSLHFLFDLVLPSTIVNSRGTEEDPLAYIIRHTQLLPRHMLAIFNAALSQHHKATGTFRGVTEKAIRDGITSVERLIADQILMPFEQIYPKLLRQCRMILTDLNPICDYKALQKIEGRFHRQIEDDISSVWHTLFDIGILGRSTSRSGWDTHEDAQDDRYCYGQFHFNLDGAFSLPTHGEFCFHPVFTRAFGIVRRDTADRRVVYPAHINLEDVYEDS